MDSILTSIKKLLGIAEDYTAFDQDIILHINSVFSILHQMGVGPDTTFIISGKESTWSQFTTNKDIESLKTLVYLRVRILFDPPASSVLMDAINKTISELEWRLYSMSNF